MGNHFHALLEIPNKTKWLAQFDGPGAEMAFWCHLAIFYDQDSLKALRRRVEFARASGDEEVAAKIIGAIKRRMCDVSLWAKEVKERYSRWLNRRRNRQGIIWMERFRNVFVQNGEALQVMATYIDLNPVRAGLARHPQEYRWGGFAAAIGGSKQAQTGERRLLELAKSLQLDEEAALRMYGSWIEPEIGSSAPDSRCHALECTRVGGLEAGCIQRCCPEGRKPLCAK